MGPFSDHTRPWLKAFRVERSDRVLSTRAATGAVDLVVEAYDTTPLAIAGPWGGKPVTPTLIRWRLVDARGKVTVGWRTAVDTRLSIPSNDRYHAAFAHWTRQNKKYRPGRYRFYLAHAFDTTRFAAGTYTVHVEATDGRGNTGRMEARLVVRGR